MTIDENKSDAEQRAQAERRVAQRTQVDGPEGGSASAKGDLPNHVLRQTTDLLLGNHPRSHSREGQ